MYFKGFYCIKNKFEKSSDKVQSYRLHFIYNMQEVYTINFTSGNHNILMITYLYLFTYKAWKTIGVVVSNA